jgi:hypothetical protein
MNQKIEALQKRLDVEHSIRIESENMLRNQIQELYNEIFKADKKLQRDIKALDSSKEYGTGENDYYRWVRLKHFEPKYKASDESNEAEMYRDCLRSYLGEFHCADIDFKNDALTASIGGCIIINDDGDVFNCDDVHSGKVIIDSDDYKTEAERNRLIEDWMEKNGYFPGVFRQTNYGDLYHVDTRRNRKRKPKAK